MKSKVSKKAVAVFLSALMILTMLPMSVFAEFEVSTDTLDSNGMVLVSNTETNIAPGIKENKIITNNKQGTSQVVGYAVSIDTSNPTVSLAAGYNDYDGTKWDMQTVRSQAAAYTREHQNSGNVVVAVNADIYNMATGEPTNVLVMDGTVYKKGIGGPYFGVTKEGKYVIGQSLTEEVLATLDQAVGGFFTIVENHQRVNNGSTHEGDINVPKTCVGQKDDGSLIIYTATGRNFPISNGLDNYDLASIMISLGCKTVINLDGGGSSTYLARYEGEEHLGLKNRPSDGVERSVSSTLFVISSAKPSGEFDHASIAPNNELYTPYSTINFTATGVDSSGAAATLPQSAYFALDSESASMGTMEADGTFVSNGTKGTVKVNYMYEGVESGSTSIEIVDPDTVYFSNEEESLGFETSSDLNLTVKYQGRDVNISAQDIIWSTSDLEISDGAKFVFGEDNVIFTNGDFYYYTTVIEDKQAKTIVGQMLNQNEKLEFSETVLGRFDGLIFTSSDGNTLKGKVTATYKYNEDIKGSVKVIVGLLPTLIWDFEDIEEKDALGEPTGNIISAEDYYCGENGILTHSNYQRGGQESVEIVSIDDDEPVRFGSKSLKLNYDFINCGAVTEGACVGSEAGMSIPGNPTGIGAWVYAPEGCGITYEGPGTQSGLWLRGYVTEGGGSQMGYDFTLEPKQVLNAQGEWTGAQPGVYWEGWMYCEADLTQMTGPFSIEPGMTFRLMYVYGTKMGTKSAGALYFDNLQFVYGTNMDDVDNPVIDSVTYNGQELKNGDVINSNTVTIDAYFHDVQNKYTTGIDAGTTRIYIDGVNTQGNENFQYVADPDGSKNHLYDVYLGNGQHSVTVSVRDGFGNETTETRFFTVEGTPSDEPTISVLPKEESAVLGEEVNLEIRVSNSKDLLSNTTGISFGNKFGDYEVTFGDNYEGSTSFKKLTKVLSVSAEKKENAPETENDLIATVTFKVPTNLTSSEKFNYTVKSGEYEVGESIFTYSKAESALAVTSTYLVTAKPIVQGQEGTIHVETVEGENAVGVDVYYIGETTSLVGTTDENGNITTSMFSASAGFYTVYAKDAQGKLSFQKPIGVYTSQGEDAMPYGILCNATTNPQTQQAISWFSSPALSELPQVIMYRVKGTEDFTTVNAETVLQTYEKSSEGNRASNVNSVKLTDLEKGTTYEFKVGAGENMSELQTFTTESDKNDTTKFFVLGDMQADDMTNIQNIAEKLSQSTYDFGIQTGDAVDDPTSYQGWAEALSIFNTSLMGEADMIHVLGNHEYAGDAVGQKAKEIFGLPASEYGSTYSMTYGNVYIAVINYAGDSNDYKKACEWLVKDAQASDAPWKILCTHQPAYYSNLDGGNGDVHAILPKAIDEAGINVVFSGHDHSYSRTKAMTGGEVDNDEGTVYFISGSSGEKKYIAVNKPEFNFDVCTQDYTSVYMDVEATKHNFTITTYDVSVDGDNEPIYTPIDSYTLQSDCIRNGHNWCYSSADDKVTCSKCSDVNSEYDGFLKDTVTGRTVYFVDGVKKVGWLTYLDKSYYFDENGLGVRGEKTIDGIKYNFSKEGVQKEYVFHKDKDGRTRCYMGGVFITGWREIDGDLYFFTSADGDVYGSMFKGIRTILLATGQQVTYTFSLKGKLLRGSFYTYEDGRTVYYWGPTALTGWQIIDGKQYYFDEDTSNMARGLTKIGATEFCFTEEGVLCHVGNHQWKEVVTIVEPTCVSDGKKVEKCQLCSEVQTTLIEATGHIDDDVDGKCDVCGLSTDKDNVVLNWFASVYSRYVERIEAIFDYLKNLF